MPNSVCLDASFVVRMLVGPDPLAQRAEQLWAQWQRTGVAVVAPILQPFEITNALYRYAHTGTLPLDLVRSLLRAALDLDIHLYADPGLHLEALALARDFGLPATYDAHYLALARRLDAELWTADQRLAKTVAARFPRVRLLE